MRPVLALVALALVPLALPAVALAFGGHDAVGCAGCHSTHAARGAAIASLPPNTALLDPRTGRPNEPISAQCLSCHADAGAGGRGVSPVSGHFHHPFSVAKVNPKLARVPPELLRDGRFECVGCHDPHPSNPNYRYLRIAARRSPSLSELCGVCHPRPADAAAAPTPLFTSMDERAAPAPAAR